MSVFIWDLDGTLIDSYPIFMIALSETFAAAKLPFDPEKVYAFIKNHSVNAFLEAQLFSFEQLKKDFTEKSTARNHEISLMVGAKDVLDWTRAQGIQNFIYTHKGKNTYKLLEQLGISAYFKEVITSENNFQRKPHPEAINYLLEKYKLDKSQVYYIGDRPLDAQLASNSGIQSINFIEAENSIPIDRLKEIMELNL